MREIKFRVYTEIRNEVLGMKYLGIRDVSVDANNTLMQFTGLHDKNGEEIYEGDILNGENSRYIMEWYSPKACWIFRSWLGDGIMANEIELCEVIGNIKENSDLLKP